MPHLRFVAEAIAEKVMKRLLRLYFRLFHRITITGLENVPDRFDRLVVISNHASLLDGLIIYAYLKPDLKILVDTATARKPFLRLFMNNSHTIKINSLNPYSLKEAIKHVETGTPLLIFPEGRISTTGSLMKIYEGTGFITYKTGARVLPIYLDTYKTVLSRKQGGKKLFAPITMTIGKLQGPMTFDSLPPRERKKEAVKIIYQTLSELCYLTHNKPATLGREFIRICRQNKGRIIFKDATGVEISYSKALLSAFILGDRFAKYPDRVLGLLLPNLSVTALLFMGLQLFRKIPAFLNYSSGLGALNQAMELADIKVVITSRQFLERIKIGEENFKGKTLVYIEDLKNQIGLRDKIKAMFRCMFPGSFAAGNKDERLETAVILFTSGSEGIPKGVCLSHENIISNIYQCLAKIDVREDDFLLNALPMFHSFGLTVGTLMPLFANGKVFLYISPLHYRVVPEIAYDQNCTIMLGTNTFLRGFGKRAHPYDFYSMRYIFCGAEALSDEVFETYSRVYGVRVLSGYGATECAPVLAINNQLENQHGTVGKFLPGIEYRIMPAEGIDHREGRAGRLFVKGKNVMKGYLKNKKANHKFLVEDGGWYDTGDIVEITREGFIKIRGRVKRFSKISGEMISLAAVEEALAPLTTGRKEIAVMGIPDEAKGEKLIVVSDLKALDIKTIRETLKARGFSELACPKDIRLVTEIPKLGSGKINYISLKEMITSELKINT
jgi:acyl-[acyl-carrier-protein]-phospholipid O-acyltransferase/long-chain-fatty-acid--[acyl-carrier-protein] ligase